MVQVFAEETAPGGWAVAQAWGLGWQRLRVQASFVVRLRFPRSYRCRSVRSAGTINSRSVNSMDLRQRYGLRVRVRLNHQP